MMNVALLVLFHNIIPFQFFQTVQTIFLSFMLGKLQTRVEMLMKTFPVTYLIPYYAETGRSRPLIT
jgi:hypothetical protein